MHSAMFQLFRVDYAVFEVSLTAWKCIYVLELEWSNIRYFYWTLAVQKLCSLYSEHNFVDVDGSYKLETAPNGVLGALDSFVDVRINRKLRE